MMFLFGFEYTVDQTMSASHIGKILTDSLSLFLLLSSQVYSEPLHLFSQCLAVPPCLTCLSVTTLIAAANDMLMSLLG